MYWLLVSVALIGYCCRCSLRLWDAFIFLKVLDTLMNTFQWKIELSSLPCLTEQAGCICSFAFSTYKGACTTNFSGVQRAGQTPEYTNYGNHWRHQSSRWHYAPVPASAPVGRYTWPCPRSCQQRSVQPQRMFHVGDGWSKLSSSTPFPFNLSFFFLLTFNATKHVLLLSDNNLELFGSQGQSAELMFFLVLWYLSVQSLSMSCS